MTLTPYEKAAHLWRRAGFGASAREIHETVERGIDRTLDDFLDLNCEDADLDRALAEVSADTFDLANSIDDVKAWWLYRMVHARRPLREKLTLFWHGHFATSSQKVDRTSFMLDQNRTLRRLCGASFRELLEAIAKDPAMLVYLDGNSNRKGRPNENFARELMELFSLGIGNYTEKDIQEAARAFTGWHLGDGEFKFNAGLHDAGDKQTLGRSGKLDGRDVLDAIVAHAATPGFIARKLCRFFVHDSPSDAYVERVAAAYRRTNGHVGTMVETLFRDPEFFAEQNVRSIVKSPVDFAVGSMRTLDVRMPLRTLLPSLRRMGQNILAPPSVKGWDGGEAWLTSAALFERANFAGTVTTTRGLAEEPRFDPKSWARGRSFASPAELADALAYDVLQGPVSESTRCTLIDYLTPETPAKPEPKKDPGMTAAAASAAPAEKKYVFDPKAQDAKLRGAVRLLLASPEFQVC